jgi:cold shock CspA family protein/ribosome-associated translation inhibitor RaiA
MQRSEALEADIRAAAAKLEHFAEHIVSCRVTLEAPHKHQHQGKLYRATIDIHVPGGQIVANRSPSEHHAHEDAYVALRDAFAAAQRQLQDYLRVQRRKVKTHATPLHGQIIALHPEQDFGRIATLDGREIYFHRNSVVNADFDQLAVGGQVRFDEEIGDRGPQATTVHVIGKHHIVE